MTSKKTKLKVTKRNNKAGFLFLLPLIVIFIGLLGYSFYFLILNSFRDVTITFRRSEFVGLANYQTIFKDKSFWISLLNTFILSTANIFCGLTFGFIISIILNFKIKGKRFFHALFFIPSMLPIALMATVFGSMLEYTNEVNGVPFYQYFVNSIINAVFASALLVLICSFSGFAFSKIEFAGRKVIYNLVLMCLAISGPILIIPFFYIYKTAHLYNTHLAIILSECLITIPFGVLMMKNFFDGLPTELMESANVDGASIQRCFFSIYLPLAKPAIINLAVLQIMWSFQDFLFPLMFLTKDKAYTTSLIAKCSIQSRQKRIAVCM